MSLPGAVTTTGADIHVQTGLAAITNLVWHYTVFGTPMRAAPTVTLYNPTNGGAGQVTDGAAGGIVAGAVQYPSERGFIWTAQAAVANATMNMQVQWAANARL